MNDKIEVSREKYWDEKTDSEKIAKLAEAVEILGRTCIELGGHYMKSPACYSLFDFLKVQLRWIR